MENNNHEEGRGGNNNQESERERVILINPFNQTIIVHGGGAGNASNHHPFGWSQIHHHHPSLGSLGDYFVGPESEQHLQHLAENDPNRYGTPPAQKEAVEAMLTVRIDENSIQCWVCLEEFEVGSQAREMPCKHRFHGDCILPWLEIHSSCPVWRYQLPADESKDDLEQDGSRGGLGNSKALLVRSESGGNNQGRFSASLPWPFSSLFSNSTSNSNSSSPSLGDNGPRIHEAEDSH